MAQYNEKKKATNAKWDKENLDRMSIAVPKGMKDRIKAAASDAGESANTYILTAVKMRMGLTADKEKN